MNSIGGYMGIKEKDKSLLEVAIELLEVKKKPQKMLKTDILIIYYSLQYKLFKFRRIKRNGISF